MTTEEKRALKIRAAVAKMTGEPGSAEAEEARDAYLRARFAGL